MSHTETNWSKPHTHGGTDCAGGPGCPVFDARWVMNASHEHGLLGETYDPNYLCAGIDDDCPKAIMKRDAQRGYKEVEPLPTTFDSPLNYNSVKDSGARREVATGSVRDQAVGKGRYDLLPPYSIKRLAQHFENGAAKYGDRNWELGQPLSWYIDSAIRHGFNVSAGMKDEDHVAAAAWNWLAFMFTAEQIRLGKLPAELDNIGWVDSIDTVGPTD
jgi:hypothetical protein